MVDMETLLDQLDEAIGAVGAVDLHGLTVDALALSAVRVQRSLDRLRAVHALIVVEADRARVWHGSGARNMAEWLANETKTSYGDAVRQTKLGDSMERSDTLAKGLDSGEISAATADALHDALAAPPEGADPDELVDAVKGSGPKAALEAAEKWKEINGGETSDQRHERTFRRRSVRSSAPVDGSVTTTVVLPTLEAREFLAAVTAAAGKWMPDDGRTREQWLADGVVNLAKAYARGQVVGGRERPTILIVIDVESYMGANDQPGRTAYGDWVPADVVRRMSMNANLRRVMMNGSEVLNLGHEVRFASAEQFQALVVRDGCCRYGDCDIPAAWCDVDHLRAHTEGGPTDLIELALLCNWHHHVKHRSGVIVHGDGNHFSLELPNGTIIDCPAKGRPRQQAAA
jgi:hypothetical protein